MARFESSRGGPRRGSSNRGPQRKSYGDRDSGRNNYSNRRRDSERGRDRRDVEMTEVTCSSCGKICEVPFKPTSDKPVYCDECFSKKGKSGSDKNSNLNLINEKLDKIMKALKIE